MRIKRDELTPLSHGGPSKQKPGKFRVTDLPERFAKKIAVRDGCWHWLAHTNHKGYAIYSVKSHPVSAHRYAYEALVGEIPEELQIDHLCRNRACVNPGHLETVTCRENLMRGDTIARKYAERGAPCPPPEPGMFWWRGKWRHSN